ncbi:hypothetical protein Tco_0929616, partial [Tanacetum coccineum]
TSDMKEILLQCMLEENYDKGHEDHRMAYEALQTSIRRDESEQFDADKSKERKKMKSKQDSPKTPPGSPHPPPPPLPPSSISGDFGTTGASDSAQDPLTPPPSPTPNPDDQSSGSAAPGSSKTAATTAYIAWTTTTPRFEPSASSIPKDVFMHEESDFAAQDMVSDDEDIGSRHIPRVNLKQDLFKPLSEDERPATPEPTWFIPSSSLSVPTHNWASAIASSYVPPPENSLLSQTGDWFCKKQGITELTSEHLEGPMEECHKLLTNQVDDRLLRYNVSKPLPLGGPPSQVMIQKEFFFNRDLDYLRFGSKGDRIALSITKMKAAYYPNVGLEQMVPDQMWIEAECMYDISATYGISHWWSRRQKFYIDRQSAEPTEELLLPEPLTAKGQEDSLLCCQPMDQESGYQTTGRRLPTQHREDKYGMQMIMCFNEIYKFSDGTLQQIDEALDYRVKEFRVNKVNLGLNTRFWTTNDVIKSKQFMFAIQKRLKLRRIFWNLESFVGHLNHLPPRDKKILSTAVNLWIKNLVIRQRVEDFQLGIESYQTQLNLSKRRWEATGLEFMHNYKILDSLRAILFRDKFSDGTLQQIDEALDYGVKEFKVNKNNPALNTRFWTTNDVIKSKQFMFAIQKRLKLRRIFQNLESFVGGRIR